MGSLAYISPLLAILYFIPAINLGGIPPFSGFLGKIILLEAGAREGSWQAWVLIAGAIITSLLTLYTMVLVWSKAFWRDRKDAPDGATAIARPAPLVDVQDEVSVTDRSDVGRMPVGMVASTSILLVASLMVSVLAGPISAITGRAAESAQDVNIYRTAVLGPNYENPHRTLEMERYDQNLDDLDTRSESELGGGNPSPDRENTGETTITSTPVSNPEEATS